MNDSTLLDLYDVASKHSHYQILPTVLDPVLPRERLSMKSRHEKARLAYITSQFSVAGLHVADIGGNTGFFSFELLARYALRVDYYEGNKAHHDFVRAAAQQLGLGRRLHTFNRYVTFAPGDLAPVDCTVLLNVLHHLGDDFGDASLNKEAAKQNILACLAALSRTSRFLIFQLGFNWKGDRHQPLFDHGTKAELIDFVTQGTSADWFINTIGIGEKSGETVAFKNLNRTNIARADALGEFLNRPIFLMQSKHR